MSESNHVTATIDMAALCFDVLIAKLTNSRQPSIGNNIPNEAIPLFVTWKKGRNHDLRGCIGTFSNLRLHEGLPEYAKISAFKDRRFDPISKTEVQELQCGVSLLIHFEIVPTYTDWEVGVHGIKIYFSVGGQTLNAVFLPEVASEQGWNHIETINNLIRKAGYSGRIDESLRRTLEIERFQSSKIVLDFKDYVEYKKSRGEPVLI